MKKCVVLMLFLIIFFGFYYSVEAGLLSYKHTAALMIGQGREKVLAQAERILIRPKQVIYAYEGTPEQIEFRRYVFTELYDVILYFYKDEFIECELIEPNSNTYPASREDYKDVRNTTSAIIGYMIERDGNVLTIRSLSKAD